MSKKRLVAGVLWFYAGWYAGGMLAAVLGLPDALGPLVGLVSALAVSLDPAHVIWRHEVALRS